MLIPTCAAWQLLVIGFSLLISLHAKGGPPTLWKNEFIIFLELHSSVLLMPNQMAGKLTSECLISAKQIMNKLALSPTLQDMGFQGLLELLKKYLRQPIEEVFIRTRITLLWDTFQ